MTFKTKVVWGNGEAHDYSAKESELIASGVTDGTTEVVDGAIVRSWTTREAAQSWIDFLNTHSTKPAEAVVVEE